MEVKRLADWTLCRLNAPCGEYGAGQLVGVVCDRGGPHVKVSPVSEKGGCQAWRFRVPREQLEVAWDGKMELRVPSGPDAGVKAVWRQVPPLELAPDETYRSGVEEDF